MRSALVCVAALGCGDNTAVVPATVVHVNVTASCSGSQCDALGQFGDCGYELPLLESQTRIDSVSGTASDAMTGIVQVQYTGEWVAPGYDGKAAHADSVLASGDRAAIYDIGGGGLILYALDGDGNVTDIDATKLVSADAGTLRFTYDVTGFGVTEQIAEEHMIDAPRVLLVDNSEPGIMDACCSVGRPREFGLVGIVLLALTRRRRITSSAN